MIKPDKTTRDVRSVELKANNGSFKLDVSSALLHVWWFEGLKACLQWKVHLAYPASLQALHSYT